MEVADRISVMRDGKLVGTYPASSLDSTNWRPDDRQRFATASAASRPAEAPALEVSIHRRASIRIFSVTSSGESPRLRLLGSGGRTVLSLFGMSNRQWGNPRHGKVVNFTAP